MRDGDNKEPFAARGGLWKPPVPPLPGAGSPSTCPGSTWACRGIWGGHVLEPPLPLGSTYGPSRQLSNSRKLGRSGNEGNKCWHLEKKNVILLCGRYLWAILPVITVAFFWNRFAFSRREWSEAMKSAWSRKAPNLAQPDPSWGKTAPRFGNANIAEVCNSTMLKQEPRIILKRGRNEFSREFLDLSQNTLGSPCFLWLLVF